QGAEHLGSDDMVILVGNSADPVLGNMNEPVTAAHPASIGGSISGSSSPVERRYSYMSDSGSMVLRLYDDASGERFVKHRMMAADLWGGTWTANPDGGNTFTQVYAPQMPVGIRTSQGLV